MDGTIYCLVDRQGQVYLHGGAESYADVAARWGLDEQRCRAFRYDLVNRRLVAEPGSRPDSAVTAFFDQRFGTPDRLMRFAQDGGLSKPALADLLDPQVRDRYLAACRNIEQQYTAMCAASGDPCLPDGCSMDEASGEICLQPLLRAGDDYRRACAAAWVAVFADEHNRTPAWRH
jgi:hypothetical protein